MLSVPACNLRECAPFASFPNPDLEASKRARVTELGAQAQAALTQQDFPRP
ncbi:MAG: hypothetical protein M5U12_14480 [Verrucomicrobia bacterium]|nr:hypothetical protein [Verrucomicrobiota bacterium]